MITRLEDFRAYNLAMDLGEDVWNSVQEWNKFAKDTVGIQLVRSVDSIAANLSEGLGRFHYKEAKNLTYYSRGSLFETKTWLTKARNRKLISGEVFIKYIEKLESLGRMTNAYINSLGPRKDSTC
jgi:four helix bundle protein